MTVHALVITGSMGSGKTTILGEASDLLAAAGIAHATVDLDAIGVVGVPDETAADLESRHLEAIFANVAGAGITRVLLAEAVESRSELARLARAMPGAELLVCRLTASIGTMEARIRVREPGMLQDEFVARVRALDDVLTRAAIEHFAIANDRRPATEVARELLTRAGWLA